MTPALSTPTLFLLEALRRLGPCPAPTRCPYCPAHTPPHWIGWGGYERWALDPGQPVARKVAVPRYQCKIQRRTFSLLPDGLLPYRCVGAGLILTWLHALFVDGVPLSILARQVCVARGTLRGLRAGFLRAVLHLRLPRQRAARAPVSFLEALAQLPPAAVVPLFQAWKETEPKHCVVGIHSRSRRRAGPPDSS
jgi:hypothetical protein